MPPLFRSKDEKVAANAEVLRLKSLQPADLAAEIMPAFGPGGPPFGGLGNRGINVLMICNWLMRSYRRAKGVRQLWGSTREALRLLEQAGLVENLSRAPLASAAAQLRATAVGQTVLAEGTVYQHLKAD